MHFVKIEGIDVSFPYKPYDIQIDYMKCVIKSLKENSNALLESPTGTGKTLSLLCASLAWIESLYLSQLPPSLANDDRTVIQRVESINNQLIDKQLKRPPQNVPPVAASSASSFGWVNSVPKIIYSSRTHSQLSQAIGELKNTYYRTYPAVVLGSRDQLCMNPDVKRLESLAAKNQMCRTKVAMQNCPYYNNYEQKVLTEKDYTESAVLDIEDLVSLGKRHKCCPYYASRALKSKATVTFTPYNYLLDPSLCHGQQFELNNAVVIFDEGHNIEKVCEESVSSELRSETLALCIKEVSKVLETLKEFEDTGISDIPDVLKELNIESVANIKMILCDFEDSIDKMLSNVSNDRTSHNSDLMFDLMNQNGIGINNCFSIFTVIDRISLTITSSNTLTASASALYSAAFNKIVEFFRILFPNSITTESDHKLYQKEFIKKYKIFTTKGDANGDYKKNEKSDPWLVKKIANSWTINMWCLSPSVGINALFKHGIHNIIITSGTLSPLNSFDIEMGIPFPIQLQNPHVIRPNQMQISVISKSLNGTTLSSKYDNKDNMEYYRAIGLTLVDIFKIVCDGLFVFFPSYTALNKTIQIWRENDTHWRIWRELNTSKTIFLEPKGKDAFSDALTKFKNKIDEKDSIGAAFFGVCRGKLAEGMDLSNHYCRAVVMTGLPFPCITDPRIILKKKYVDEIKNLSLTGNGWYGLQMKRALNQAIGRVVRHKDDFGAVILCDARFSNLRDGLSKWIDKHMTKELSTYEEKIERIRSFFVTHNLVNKSRVMCLEVSDNSIVKPKKDFKSLNVENSVGVQCEGFANESKIISELCGQNFNHQTFDISCHKTTQTNSVFDAISLNQSVRTLNCNNYKRLNGDLNEKEFENNSKRKKLNVKLRSITDADVDADAASSVMIQSKGEVNKDSKKQIKKNNETNDELIAVWKKYSEEIRKLFEGTMKYQNLCESIRKYKTHKNILTLIQTLNSVFEKVERGKRDSILVALSAIVPKTQRRTFLEHCHVSAPEVKNSLEIATVIKRVDKKAEHIHICDVCFKVPPPLIHRSLCCGTKACMKCWKIMRNKNSNACFCCLKPLKLSDLKQLKFRSAK